MSSLTKDRRLARILAVDALYQAEIREQLPAEALALLRDQGWSVTLTEAPGPGDEAPSDEAVAYATRLVEGFQTHAAVIDELIDRHAEHWAIDRMPVVDKNLLRLAIFELLWEPSVPAAVVINEAIELAKAYSTDKSGGFINGMLGQIAGEIDAGAQDP